MTMTTLRLLTLVLAGIAYAVSGYLTGSGHDGLIAVASALLGWTVPMPAQVKRPSIPPIAIVLLVLLAVPGCAALGALAESALQALAPRAIEALGDVLSGAEPVAAAGVCKALPDDYQPDEFAVVACAGEGATQRGGAASVSLAAVADDAGEQLDEATALCEQVRDGKLKVPVYVCGAMYAELDE